MRAFIWLALAAASSAQSGLVIQSEADVNSVAFTRDGAWIAADCRDGQVRVWDARSGALKRTVRREEGDTAEALPSPADLLGIVGKGGSIRILDLQTGELKRRIAGPSQRTRGLVFSPDRSLVAVSSRTGDSGSEETVRVWDANGKQLFAAPAGLGGTSAMAISPDGATLVAGSWDTNVRAWSTRNGELRRLIEDLPVSMFAIAFSPDGKYLAAAGVDSTIYLWDAKSLELSRKLTGQPEMIGSMAFSADSRRLLTGGFNELTTQHPVSVLLWDVSSGKAIKSFPSPHAVRALTFAPDGRTAAVACQKTISFLAMP
ncbi:MAG TPA: WD40 repeat domain-containing protein [Bryobacteraceae bacterium]|jgi:WD40 repeat protein|nr:WD40 repeat domain-containing protein [Bryobacteraceae bacterium]